jgi:hypothetical protein
MVNHEHRIAATLPTEPQRENDTANDRAGRAMPDAIQRETDAVANLSHRNAHFGRL